YPGYEQIAPVEVPDANLLGVYAPRTARELGIELDEEAVLAQGFAQPHGAPRLRAAVQRDDRVLLLIEDGTRGTPIPRLLAYVMDELHAAGVPDERIVLLTAPGTHREMNEEEL